VSIKIKDEENGVVDLMEILFEVAKLVLAAVQSSALEKVLNFVGLEKGMRNKVCLDKRKPVNTTR
jgi:hypothetical protein